MKVKLEIKTNACLVHQVFYSKEMEVMYVYKNAIVVIHLTVTLTRFVSNAIHYA